MTKDEKIHMLLYTLASVYRDAEMAINNAWDKSDKGFEAQQILISDTIYKAGLLDEFTKLHKKTEWKQTGDSSKGSPSALDRWTGSVDLPQD